MEGVKQMLTIQNVHKTIEKKSILTAISFTQNLGEIIGLVGRNGVGKSTLLRCIAGSYQLDDGQVLIDQTDVAVQPEMRTQLFYLDEAHLFFKGNQLLQIGRYYAQAYPDFDTDQLTDLLAMYHLDGHQRYQQMSKGMQGLFNIILAVCSHARYLLLDEPFDGLDVIVRKNIIRLLLDHVGQTQTAVLITSHNLVELDQLIDRTLILKETKIIKDYQLEQLRQTDRKLQIVLKTNTIPALFKEAGRVLSVSGRVMVVYFPNYSDELAAQIQAYEPVLCESLPITLEDLFEANLVTEEDYQVFI